MGVLLAPATGEAAAGLAGKLTIAGTLLTGVLGVAVCMAGKSLVYCTKFGLSTPSMAASSLFESLLALCINEALLQLSFSQIHIHTPHTHTHKWPDAGQLLILFYPLKSFPSSALFFRTEICCVLYLVFTLTFCVFAKKEKCIKFNSIRSRRACVCAGVCVIRSVFIGSAGQHEKWIETNGGHVTPFILFLSF